MQILIIMSIGIVSTINCHSMILDHFRPTSLNLRCLSLRFLSPFNWLTVRQPPLTSSLSSSSFCVSKCKKHCEKTISFYILTRCSPQLHTPTTNGVKIFPKVLVIFEHKLSDKVFTQLPAQIIPVTKMLYFHLNN